MGYQQAMLEQSFPQLARPSCQPHTQARQLGTERLRSS